MNNLNSALSSFGSSLANATRLRQKGFDTSTSVWPNAYKTNAELINKLRNTIRNKPDVLLIGAGRNDGLNQIKQQTQGWLRSGVHWSNFNPVKPGDIGVSTHATPLESLCIRDNQPKLLIHGVYSKVPACFNRSCIFVGQIHIDKEWKVSNVERIEALMRSKSVGVAPYIPAVKIYS